MKTLRLLWESMRFPLIWIGFIALLFGTWWLLKLPSQDELIPLISYYFSTYGIGIVFVAALLESMLIVGWYFPGGVVIFLSVSVSPTPLRAALVVLTVMCGLYIGYALNFFIGKYGWYRLLLKFGIRQQLQEAQANLLKHGAKAILWSYWMPGVAAIVATAAGVLQYDVKKFFWWSALGTIGWSAFIGTVVYWLGEKSLSLVLNPVIIVAIIVAWGLLRFVGGFIASRKEGLAQDSVQREL